MKRNIVVIVTLLFFSSLALGQELLLEPTQDPNAPYRLFSTANTYVFLRLDTRDGRMWQMYWRDRTHNDIEPLNTEALASDGRAGRFTLYPTTNISDFLLLDQETGDAWHVRWGAVNDRFIVQIEPN